MNDFGRARADLVDDLVRDGHLRSAPVRAAFLAVPRERFVTEDLHRKAYVDTPLPIPMGQTISAPSMIAIMLEEAELADGQRVLDVG
ncbi:MAG: protein-L-isoaspartate O-methyltransferase, partial [Candidatus Thermoplasmatota archaeon]